MGSEKNFDDKIKNFVKKVETNVAFKASLDNLEYSNDKLWRKRKNDQYKVFKSSKKHETLMLTALNQGNTKKMLELAHKGLVTEKFLEALMSLRTSHEDRKRNGQYNDNNDDNDLQAIQELNLNKEMRDAMSFAS